MNSDGFSGLRALLLPSDRRKPMAGGRRRRTALLGVEDAGRWALIRRAVPADGTASATLPRETVEQIARTLLKRYGVVFWRLLAREAEWLPPWRELLMACGGSRRAERSAAAASSPVSPASSLRCPKRWACCAGRATKTRPASSPSSAAPTRSTSRGFCCLGPRSPALYSNRVVFRDGIAMAALVSGEVQYFEKLDPEQAWEMKNLLLRTPAPAGLAALLS